MQDAAFDKLLEFLLRLVNVRHYPWVHGDEITKWPKGSLEKLLEMGILRPSNKVSQTCECPVCHDETAEPFWCEYPDGRMVPVWYCRSDAEETDRVEIDPKLLGMWDIRLEKLIKYVQPTQVESKTAEPSQLSEDTSSPEPNSIAARIPASNMDPDASTSITLAPRCERAFRSYIYAQEHFEYPIKDKEAYYYLKEHGWDGYDERNPLPDIGSWQAYLCAARKFYGLGKNSARAGREGRSVVRKNQI